LSRVLLGKLIGTQIVKFPAFYGTREFITLFTIAAPGKSSDTNASNPQIFTLFLQDLFYD
jgi:hypothetical protein